MPHLSGVRHKEEMSHLSGIRHKEEMPHLSRETITMRNDQNTPMSPQNTARVISVLPDRPTTSLTPDSLMATSCSMSLQSPVGRHSGRSILMQQLMSPDMLPGSADVRTTGASGDVTKPVAGHLIPSSHYQEVGMSSVCNSTSRNNLGDLNHSPVDHHLLRQVRSNADSVTGCPKMFMYGHDNDRLYTTPAVSSPSQSARTNDQNLHTRITSIIAEELQKQEIKHNVALQNNSCNSFQQKPQIPNPPRPRKRATSSKKSPNNTNVAPQNIHDLMSPNSHVPHEASTHLDNRHDTFHNTPHCTNSFSLTQPTIQPASTSGSSTLMSHDPLSSQLSKADSSRRQAAMHPLSDEYIAYLLRTEKTSKCVQPPPVNHQPMTSQSNIPRFLSPHPSLHRSSTSDSWVTHLQNDRKMPATDYPEDLSMNNRKRRNESLS